MRALFAMVRPMARLEDSNEAGRRRTHSTFNWSTPAFVSPASPSDDIGRPSGHPTLFLKTAAVLPTERCRRLSTRGPEQAVTSAFESSEGGTSVEARPRSMPRIGEMMIARGLITHEQLEVALDHQRASGKLMGEILVELGHLDAVDLTRILAERRGYQFVDLRDRSIDLTLMDLVPEDVARRYSALPLAHQDDHVVVAMAQPENVFALDDLRVLTELPVFPVMAEPGQIADAIARCYTGSVAPAAADPVIHPSPASSAEPLRQTAADAIAEQQAEAPVDSVAARPEPVAAAPAVAPEENEAMVRLVSVLFEQAMRERATDVHIDALSDRLRVRFRIDGVLREVSDAPLTALRPLMSRVKTLAGMDVGRTRVPREGNFALSVEDRHVDVRVTIVPTSHDDSCVLRLIDRERAISHVDGLGLSTDQRTRYLDVVRKRRGLVVVGGPAGSGRTSTLYATLHLLNTPERSVASVEGSVEYAIDGVKQVQVDELAGLSFPNALRLIRRSDPEIVLVDAINDRETAALATDAAVAGQLVLAALHAPNTAAVPARLLDMGVEPYLLATALAGVVAQRLVRSLCPHCSEDDSRSRPLLQKLGCQEDVLDRATLRRPVGCEECLGTGYLGRRGVFEVMPVSDAIAALVREGASEKEIKRAAVSEGMETLRGSALTCALAGETSLEEVLRAIA
jgi:type IV pilus assembly protein PilB